MRKEQEHNWKRDQGQTESSECAREGMRVRAERREIRRSTFIGLASAPASL